MASSDESTEMERLIGPEQRRLSSKEEVPVNMVRFGPTYGEDTEVNRRVKDSAWQHVIQEKDGGNGIESSYIKLIKDIEKEVVECYDNTNFNPKLKPGHKLRKMMARDGCFFLQLALHILGAGDSLGYSPHHPYFREGSDSSSWIPAMFYVGNQIPYVVINALMKQPFFQDVIDRGNWERLGSGEEDDVAKLALYQTVVEPQLTKKRGHRRHREPPSDVLVALRNVLLGSPHNIKVINHPISFSGTRALSVDLEAGIDDEIGFRFPDAKDLLRSAIRLKKAERGITNVQFKSRRYFAYLHVPPLVVDAHTELLLTSLLKLEKQSGNNDDREVTAYIRFIADLAKTYEDFMILEDRGIIQVKDEKLKRTTLKMLRTLAESESLKKSQFTTNFREIRRRITEYEIVPWRLISFISMTASITCGIITFILAVLTVVQTVYAVLSYSNSST